MPLDLIDKLNSLSPLGLAGGLAYIIYLQIKMRKGQDNLRFNHVHEIKEALEDIKGILQVMNDNIVWIKAKINGS
mgnify:FL=1